jgi:hypothetical protein
VQRGTSHAWLNKGKEPALIAAVRIDAKAYHEKRPKRPNATAGLASER